MAANPECDFVPDAEHLDYLESIYRDVEDRLGHALRMLALDKEKVQLLEGQLAAINRAKDVVLRGRT